MNPILLAVATRSPAAVAAGAEPQFALSTIVSGIGYLAIFSALIYIGRKLHLLDTLVSTVDKMKQNLKLVTDSWLLGLPLDATKLQAYSPVQLTDNGRTFLRDIGFITLFTTHAADFFAVIDREHPTNDYDIENLANKSVLQLFSCDYFAPIKEYFYNHPNENRGSFVRVAGTYVRDQYMNEVRRRANEPA